MPVLRVACSERYTQHVIRSHSSFPIGDVPQISTCVETRRYCIGDQVLDAGVDAGQGLREIGDERRCVGKNKVLRLGVDLLALLLVERVQPWSSSSSTLGLL